MKLRKYINSIYKPAFVTLCIGLSLFSLGLCILAVNLRMDILAGKSDIIYRYPDMLKEIIFPIYIIIPMVFVIDLNERNKKS